MDADAGTQTINQYWVHVIEVIGDSQNDNGLVLERGTEALIESLPMYGFHYYDEVCPLDLIKRKGCIGIFR